MKLSGMSLLFKFILTVVFLSLANQAHCFNVTQITDSGYSTHPQINSKGQIVFVKASWLNASGYPQDEQLYLYDQGTITKISENFSSYGTFPAFPNFDLNDNGEVVWIGTNNELWMFSNGTAQRISPEYKIWGTPDINNNGQVVFASYPNYSLMLYSNGQTSVIYEKDPTNDHPINCSAPRINDKGEIAWQWHDPDPYVARVDIYLYSNGVVSALTNDEYYDEYPLLNENGDVAWQKDGVDEATDHDIYLYHNGSISRITNAGNNEWYASDYFALNDQAQVVWPGNSDIWFYSDGVASRITTDGRGYGNPHINNNGKLVFHKDGIFLYDGARVLQVENLPYGAMARINDSDQVVWQRIVNQGWRIFLADTMARDISVIVNLLINQ